VAGNKGPHGRSVTPLTAGVGRRRERKWQKLVGRDKGSLTEQQTKQTVTTTILIRKIYKINSENAQSNSHRLVPSALLSHDSLPSSQLPHPEPNTMTHGI